MNDATITPTDNGHYLVKGNVTLLDAEGNAYQGSDTIALCRCGLSATKPFCDGSHEKTYFKAVNRASRTSRPIRSRALVHITRQIRKRQVLVDVIRPL
jgi:CDGSH-type Zn-finger protein